MRLFFALFLYFIFIFTNTFANTSSDIRDLIEMGELDNALDLTKTLPTKSKEDIALRDYLIGSIYFKLGKFQKAEDFFINASTNSTNEEYYASLAKNYLFLGKINQAKTMANTTLELNKDTIEAIYVLAKAEVLLGNNDLALNFFAKFDNIKKSNEQFNIFYARIYDELGMHFDSVSRLESFILRNPSTPKAHDYLGRLHWFYGDSAKAIDYRTKARDLYIEGGREAIAEVITAWLEIHKDLKLVPKKKEIFIQEQDNSETLITEDSVIDEPKVNNDDSRQTHFIAYEPGVIEPFPVKATDEIYSGSGFIVNNGTQVITNQHVIEANKTIYVRNGIGELRKATVRKAVKSDDLALLDLERPFSSEYSLDIPNNYKLRIGQKAYVMGFPLADFLGENMPSITEGIISKDVGMLNYPGNFQLTSKLNSGNSGGPIFSDQGDVIGVAVGKIDKAYLLENEGLIPEDVNFAIKLKLVNYLTDIGIEIDKNKSKLTAEELYYNKLPSVVMIINVVN